MNKNKFFGIIEILLLLITIIPVYGMTQIPSEIIEVPTGTVKILVMDAKTGLNLFNAMVSVYDNNGNYFGTEATSKGSAVFYLPEGYYTAVAEADGFYGMKKEFKPMANEVVYVEMPLERKPSIDLLVVRLKEKFQLLNGQTAVVKNYKNMKINFQGQQGCAMPMEIVEKQPSVDLPKPMTEKDMWYCNPRAVFQVSMVSGNAGTARWMTLGIGEQQSMFGATITLIDLQNGIATLRVAKDAPKKR